MPDTTGAQDLQSVLKTLPFVSEAADYLVDAWQRSVLFADVLRQRSDQYREHAAKAAPHVLDYQAELVCAGWTLERPVNYALVRIIPPEGLEVDPAKRPFVIVDPRAGHGPGIGGFKADSEIGVAMKAGHPCYFVGFLPEPIPGQTIEDIARAEAVFLETVIARHPEAEGKPCVVGNCQAGWAVMLLASLRPELFGPVIIAGAPLSYWAGVRGKNPMRYTGGLLGGSWLTALAGDLGHGKFDGALLVQNFENQNPANTLWTKQYNLYSKIDTEAPRYLGFERWWGGHVMLNAEEMQFIVDELFIGNKLAAGRITMSDGMAVDLRNIRSPIVVFCSAGDNITPPQQALDWILDLYEDVDDIRAHGQTIVYSVHDRIGHLGIFVSGGVARKEHDEFASNIDLIDVLPPGLYEAVFEPRGDSSGGAELIQGDWIMRCEERTLDDIRSLGGNTLEDERKFAAAARLSEVNLALYRAFARPFVRAFATRPMAEAMRKLSPLRLQYELFGSTNPLIAYVGRAAEQVRRHRRPAPEGNRFVAMRETVSRRIEGGLDAWRVLVEKLAEDTFHVVYGSAALQAALGVDTSSARRPRKAPRSLLHKALVERRIEEIRARMTEGGVREAMARALVYVGMARSSVDERGFEAVKRLRAARPAAQRASLPEFKEMIREQFFMLLIDEEAALAAIPSLLPADPDVRREALEILQGIFSAGKELTGEPARRAERVAALFSVSSAPAPAAAARRRSRRGRAAQGRRKAS